MIHLKIIKIVLTLTCMQPSSSLSSKATFPFSAWFRKRAVPKDISLGEERYTHTHKFFAWTCCRRLETEAPMALPSSSPARVGSSGPLMCATPSRHCQKSSRWWLWLWPLASTFVKQSFERWQALRRMLDQAKNVIFQCSIKDVKPVVPHNRPTGILGCKVSYHLRHQLPTLLCVGNIFQHIGYIQEGSYESRNAVVILLPEAANLLVKAEWRCGPTRLCHTCLTYPYQPSCATCL